MNYHRAHIKNFSEISSPLYDLTRKDVKFTWTDEHLVAFEHLKALLTTSPCLSFPRSNDEPFILDTDTSNFAIGAELLHIQDGQERVISYGSYALTPSQRNYCATRKELLAIVQFTRQFRHYLLGRRFYVKTDHSSLSWLMAFKNPVGMLARWLEELSQYDMVIVHRKGKSHVNADGLSRIPDPLLYCNCYTAGCSVESLPCGGCHFCKRAHKEWARFEDDVDDVVPLAVHKIGSDVNRVHPVSSKEGSFNGKSDTDPYRYNLVFEGNGDFADSPEYPDGLPFIRQVVLPAIADDTNGTSLLSTYTSSEMRDLQLSDPDIGSMIHWLEGGKDITQQTLSLTSRALKHFWRNKELLYLKNGVLFYRWLDNEGITDRHLLVVPHPLKQEVLHLCHDLKASGHPGMARTLERVRQANIWFGMRIDCSLFVKSCALCNKQKKANTAPKGALGMYQVGSAGERIHLDILGPFPKSQAGNRYILMLVCQFTKWLEVYPLPEQTAEQISRVVIDNFISRFGIPVHIHTDQGANFTSALFHEICKLLEIAKTRTTPYPPCSNGQVERYNRTLLQLIRCHLKDNTRWDEDGSVEEHPGVEFSLSLQLIWHPEEPSRDRCNAD